MEGIEFENDRYAQQRREVVTKESGMVRLMMKFGAPNAKIANLILLGSAALFLAVSLYLFFKK
jgi:hypothetical protein